MNLNVDRIATRATRSGGSSLKGSSRWKNNISEVGASEPASLFEFDSKVYRYIVSLLRFLR